MKIKAITLKEIDHFQRGETTLIVTDQMGETLIELMVQNLNELRPDWNLKISKKEHLP